MSNRKSKLTMTVTGVNSNMIKIINFLLAVSVLLLISGCVSSGSLTHTQNAPTMEEIYEAHFFTLAYDEKDFVFLHDRDDSSHISEVVVENLEQTFPTLKNPFLVMYVYPHLDAEDGTPIPGYWTTFPMYEQIEFALPGELIDSGDRD